MLRGSLPIQDRGLVRRATRDKEIPTVSRRASNALVFLLFAELWLASSNLDKVQIAVELLLGIVLIAVLLRCGLSASEIALSLIYVVSMGASALLNPLHVTLLNAKIFGLSILSLLVFSKLHFNAPLVMWVLGANAVMTVYQWLLGEPGWFVYIIEHVGGSWRELLGSRPLGLFMSTHVSATLTAVFFLMLGRFKWLTAAAGITVLAVNRSIFVLLAYICQLLSRLVSRLRLEVPLAIAFVGVVLWAFANPKGVIDFDVTLLGGYFTEREQIGYSQIAEQLLSPNAYSWLLTFVPRDSLALALDFIVGWGNEVGYVLLVYQGGLVLAVFYLAMLFARIPGFRIFMAVTMVHNGMATTPIIIFLLAQYSLAADWFAMRDRTGEGLPAKSEKA